MTPDRFKEIANKRIEHCQKLLLSKGEEYSREGDRLHNFKSSARIDNTTPSRDLWGYWKKHITSLKDMVDDLDKGIFPSQKLIDDKLSDMINYSLLFEGIIEDMRTEYEASKTTSIESVQQSNFIDQACATANNITEICKTIKDSQINPTTNYHKQNLQFRSNSED